MRKFFWGLLGLFVFGALFSACGNTESEIAISQTTATADQTTASETTAEKTMPVTEPVTEATTITTTEVTTDVTTEATLSSEEQALQAESEQEFNRVLSDVTWVQITINNEIPMGENELSNMVSGMSTNYSVDKESELMEEIRLRLNSPNLVPVENTECYEEDHTAVIWLENLEDDYAGFYFRYIPNDSAATSELMPLCYTVVGFETYVYSMTEETIMFFDDLFDGIYIRSVDTWYGSDTDEANQGKASSDYVPPEFTGEELERQLAMKEAVAVKLKVLGVGADWSDEAIKDYPDFSVTYEVTDSALVAELCSLLDEENLVKYEKFLGWGRGGPWSYVTFITEDGIETTYYLIHSYVYDDDIDIYHMCIAQAGGEWYTYGLTDEAIDGLDDIFDKLYLKTIVTR